MNIWSVMQVVALWIGFFLSLRMLGVIIRLFYKGDGLESGFIALFSLVITFGATIYLNVFLARSNALVEMEWFVAIVIGVFCTPSIVLITSAFLLKALCLLLDLLGIDYF